MSKSNRSALPGFDESIRLLDDGIPVPAPPPHHALRDCAPVAAIPSAPGSALARKAGSRLSEDIRKRMCASESRV